MERCSKSAVPDLRHLTPGADKMQRLYIGAAKECAGKSTLTPTASEARTPTCLRFDPVLKDGFMVDFAVRLSIQSITFGGPNVAF